MDAIDPSLTTISDSNLQRTPLTASPVPNPYYQTPARQNPADTPFPNHPYHYEHQFTSLHEDHPGCPTSLDCLPFTGLQKPHHTLPILVRAAILGSPRQRLTIREICDAIARRFPYFCTAKENWKESIRHALSLKDMFAHMPRPDTEPGLGKFWTVNPNATLGRRKTTTPKQVPAGSTSHSPLSSLDEDVPDSVGGASSAPGDPQASIPTRGRKRGRRRAEYLSDVAVATRRLPARAAAAKRCSYAELTEEADEQDDEGYVDQIMPKTLEEGKGKAKATFTRQNGALKSSRTRTDEETIHALLAELGKVGQKMNIATAETIHLADQLTDVHADNARARAATRQAAERAEQERQATRAAEQRLSRLQRQAVELGGWRKTLEAEGVTQNDEGIATLAFTGEVDALFQALSNQPMVMIGDDFGMHAGS